MQLLLSQHRELARLIFDHEGVIFGGYLRDTIAFGENAKPNDLDFVVYRDQLTKLISRLEDFGYEVVEEDEDSFKLDANDSQLIPLEILVEDRHPNFTLGPSVDPDFNINSLCFDGLSISSWVDPYLSQQ